MRLLSGIMATAMLAGCGAPTQTAGQQAALFSGQSVSLDGRMQSVCKALASRPRAPTTNGFTINIGNCSGAGLKAGNYKAISSFQFADLPASAATAATSDTIHKAIRSQLWLNRNFLSLATAITAMMNKNGAKTGVIALPDSATKAIANIAKPVLTITAPPLLDMANIAFSMGLNLSVIGVIKANQDLDINGKLLANAFAVTIKSKGTKTYDQSLIKSMEAVIVIIPYADDVYMDVAVDLDLFNTGVQSIINTQLDTFLSTGMKAAVDAVMAL